MTLISRFSLNTEQKEKIAATIAKLYEDDGFVEFFFSTEGKQRVAALRLLFENVGDYKEFLKDNFALVDSDDIFDFTFDGWLDISEEKSQKILADAIEIYKKQKSFCCTLLSRSVALSNRTYMYSVHYGNHPKY